MGRLARHVRMARWLARDLSKESKGPVVILLAFNRDTRYAQIFTTPIVSDWNWHKGLGRYRCRVVAVYLKGEKIWPSIALWEVRPNVAGSRLPTLSPTSSTPPRNPLPRKVGRRRLPMK